MSDLATKLSEYGIDYADAIDRFDGSSDFYKKLALKYLGNPSYADLVAAMEVEDFDAAFKAAHTLKGVAGNLSFTDLYKAAAAITEALRQGEHHAAEELMGEFTRAHEQVMRGLEAWEAGNID